MLLRFHCEQSQRRYRATRSVREVIDTQISLEQWEADGYLHPSFQDKEDSLPTMAKSSAGSGIVQATPASRVSPGGTHTLPGSTRPSNLLTANSRSVHAEFLQTGEHLDRLPRSRTCESGIAVSASKSTAQVIVDKMLTRCSCHPAKCNDTA